MDKKLIGLTCSALLLGLFVTNAALAMDPSLVGWWKLDETSGQLVVDSSSKGNDGTVKGDPRWVKGQNGGALYLDGNSYVILPIGSVIESLTDCTVAGWFYWTGEFEWERVFDFGTGTANYMFLTPNTDAGEMRFAIRTIPVGAEDRITVGSPSPGWHHMAVTINNLNNEMILYLDGSSAGVTANMSNKLSDLGYTSINRLGRSQFPDALYSGYLDDFYIFNRVLSPGEIGQVLSGNFGQEYATEPTPADGEQDVFRDAILSWVPGSSAQKHFLYFGEDLNDVNITDNGSAPQVGPGQVDDSEYDPGRLEFSQTYYWRVDEVNSPPDNTVFKGDVWSFTVESKVYPVPAVNITATASSYVEGRGPERTIDGSGLNATGGHSTVLNDMWQTAKGTTLPAWIQYEFDKPYKLNKMLVWNYNGASFNAIQGLREVVIEHSMDGTTWTQPAGVSEFPMASGAVDHTADIAVDFGDTAVKYVTITAKSNYSGGLYNQCGLSEVRLMAVPVAARNPSPEPDADNVYPSTVLTWCPGREADHHLVYLSNEENAVRQGTALVHTADESQLAGSQLDLRLGQTYYWRVDEVNDVAAPSIWPGDTWTFTTAGCIVVDDFESYGNASPNRAFQTWIDGIGFTQPEPGSPGNGTGAAVGHDIWSPASEHHNRFIMENWIANSGTQSLPLYYDNSGADGRLTYSQTDRTFTSVQDWTRFGITTLIVHFYGSAGNSGELYVKINDTWIPYPGSSADLATEIWTTWEIDLASRGADLANVSTLSIGIDSSNASGLIYIDDVWLK